ncbi:hypothetical protein [Paenibacillus xylanexedens]|uniref:nSTAND3 domain-containing NTPase n=1 Tax=Paenibacillus xylanexedens TaxID=528191 RepID=UPI0011A4F49B|nr:hypothetical protein [Paenibacillus xylanexedens]
MSVELSGPQGYDYQYKQTIYIALCMMHYDQLTLIVEKKDGEDAELRFEFEDKSLTIEMQVKSERGDVTMNTFAKWIAHFTDRQSTGNLLSRLQSDPNRYALFITQSRCSDETRTLLKPHSDITLHDKSPLVGRKADMFLDALYSSFTESSPTSLKQEREFFCQQQAEELRKDRNLLREMSRRFLIWEQFNLVSLTTAIYQFLNLKFHIPSSVAGQVVSEMESAIRQARDERSDVVPRLRQILNSNAGDRVFQRDLHIPSAHNDLLVEQLGIHHLLLLTGISFCGKSHMAEWLAEHYRLEGFIYSKFITLDEAYRYLTSASSENRLCFLEDPFGHTELEADAGNSWGRLYALTDQLGPHRKLIVTSRKDLLQQLTGSDTPSNWSIGHQSWHDLTVTDAQFAIKLWSAYSEYKQLAMSIRHIVADGMRQDSTAILQPGQLRHLALNNESELADRGFESLSSLARVDAKQLGGALLNRKNEAGTFFLLVLVLITRPGFGIAEDTLFKLLDQSLSSLNKSDLLNPAKTFCEEMELSGYIAYRGGVWMFSHPTYYDAAMYIVENQSRFGCARLINILKLSLTSPFSEVAIAAVQNMRRIELTFAYEDIESELHQLTVECLKSPFPAVRDEALVFLLQQIDQLEEYVLSDVLKYINTYHVSEYKLSWHNGTPIVRNEEGYSLDEMLSSRKTFDEEAFLSITGRLLSASESSTVLAEEAWDAVRHLQFFKVNAQDRLRLLKQFMTYKEAFIREKAAFSLMNEFGEFPECAYKVFSDPHPFVILQGIQGCFQGWHRFSSDIKFDLHKQIENAFRLRANCAAFNAFMTKFNPKSTRFSIDLSPFTENDKKEIVQLWGTLLPLFLDHVPDQFININEGYLFTITSQVADSLNEQQIVDISCAWYGWIERMIVHSTPNDYGLGVVDFLIKNTEPKHPQRTRLALQILNHRDSYIVSMALAEYVSYWTILDPSEQALVMDLLQDNRPDIRWLKAIALTREEVCEPIVQLLLGDPAALTWPSPQLIALVDEQLLADSLAVISGYPGTLHSPVSMSDSSVWKRLMLDMTHEEKHTAFPITLRYLIRMLVNGWGEESWLQDVEAVCRQLCTSANAEIRRMIFKQILEWTVRVNGGNSKALWQMFFASLPPEEAEVYVTELNNYIESISLNEENPVELLGKDLFNELIQYHLPGDRGLLVLLKQGKHISQENLPLLERLFQSSPPRVHSFCQFIEKELRKSLDSDKEIISFLEVVKEQRSEIIRRGSQQKTLFNSEPELEGWITMREKVQVTASS